MLVLMDTNFEHKTSKLFLCTCILIFPGALMLLLYWRYLGTASLLCLPFYVAYKFHEVIVASKRMTMQHCRFVRISTPSHTLGRGLHSDTGRHTHQCLHIWLFTDFLRLHCTGILWAPTPSCRAAHMGCQSPRTWLWIC